MGLGSEDTDGMKRTLTLCLSMANLLFLASWLDLLRLAKESPGQMRSAPAVALFAGTLINVLVTGATLLAASFAVRALRRDWLQTAARCGFLVLTLVPLDLLGWQVYSAIQSPVKDIIVRPLWSVMLVVPLVGCILLAVYGNRSVFRAFRGIVLVLAPLLPLNLLQFAWAASTAPTVRVTGLAASHSRVPARRVVWLIFDEMDQRLVFEDRPSDIQLPELDRLRNESFFPVDAQPPGMDTPESMTTLLTGASVKKFDYASPGQKMTMNDGSTHSLWQTPTVFGDVQRMGFDTAVAGWYIHYCETQAALLTHCYEPTPAGLRPSGTATVMRDEWSDQLRQNVISTRFGSEAQFRVPWFGFGARKDHLAVYRNIFAHALDYVADPHAALVLIHWNIPHPLGIYNRHTHRLGLDFENNYIDNLELADYCLGRMREAIGKAGLADRTVLIVSADHPLRPFVWSSSAAWTPEEERLSKGKVFKRIPYLVRFPGAPREVRFGQAFDTLVTRRLIGEILAGAITTPEQLAAWLGPR
jgi:Type I phosphodiesterase / nucleotide pyrophosphatase